MNHPFLTRFLAALRGGKFKADLGCFGIQSEVSGEGALGFFGDEAGKKVGLSVGEHLFDVAGCEFLLENGLTETEAIGVVFGEEVGN